METNNSKNKSTKIVLLIFLLICSGLGIAAFVMSLKGCEKDGFKKAGENSQEKYVPYPDLTGCNKYGFLNNSNRDDDNYIPPTPNKTQETQYFIDDPELPAVQKNKPFDYNKYGFKDKIKVCRKSCFSDDDCDCNDEYCDFDPITHDDWGQCNPCQDANQYENHLGPDCPYDKPCWDRVNQDPSVGCKPGNVHR